MREGRCDQWHLLRLWGTPSRFPGFRVEKAPDKYVPIFFAHCPMFLKSRKFQEDRPWDSSLVS